MDLVISDDLIMILTELDGAGQTPNQEKGLTKLPPKTLNVPFEYSLLINLPRVLGYARISQCDILCDLVSRRLIL